MEFKNYWIKAGFNKFICFKLILNKNLSNKSIFNIIEYKIIIILNYDNLRKSL